MLLSDSMPQMWLAYAVLSLIVLVTGYFGLAFLPRLPRLVITWAVAGLMWMPSSFQMQLTDGEGFYTGLAPAAVVAGLAFLEKDGGTLSTALLLLAVAAILGALFGLLLWRRGRRKAQRVAAAQAKDDTVSRQAKTERQEPMIG